MIYRLPESKTSKRTSQPFVALLCFSLTYRAPAARPHFRVSFSGHQRANTPLLERLFQKGFLLWLFSYRTLLLRAKEGGR
jgi:hypothetical protein